jgi:phytol kinase
MVLILTVLVVFVLLLFNEAWSRRQRPHSLRHLHGEFNRKFAHITIGSFVAFWPYFLSVTDIKLLSAAFLVVVALSRYFNIFKAIHSVQRPTWGEFWFALVVGGLAFIVPQHPHIYTAALLEMALADGLAAVVGTHYGNRHRYVVFGSPKSIIGTLTFFVMSCAILAGYAFVSTNVLSLPTLLLVALSATVLENISAHGLDNLVVPLFVAGALLWV